jgi:hypothetical protein
MNDQEQIINGLTVKFFDQPHTFHVKSESREGWYVVDLIENRGLGNCTCPHFCGRLFPEYRIVDGTTKDKRRFRCKHIKACRELLTDELVIKLKEIEDDRSGF